MRRQARWEPRSPVQGALPAPPLPGKAATCPHAMLNWAYLPYTLLLSLFGIVALALSFYAARHRNLRGATAFMLLCLAGAEWAFTYALELGSEGLPTKLFWSKLEYLGITVGPVCWLAFALYYTRRDLSFVGAVREPTLP